MFYFSTFSKDCYPDYVDIFSTIYININTYKTENIQENIDLLDIISTKFCLQSPVTRVQGILIAKAHISVSHL